MNISIGFEGKTLQIEYEDLEPVIYVRIELGDKFICEFNYRLFNDDDTYDEDYKFYCDSYDALFYDMVLAAEWIRDITDMTYVESSILIIPNIRFGECEENFPILECIRTAINKIESFGSSTLANNNVYIINATPYQEELSPYIIDENDSEKGEKAQLQYECNVRTLNSFGMIELPWHVTEYRVSRFYAGFVNQDDYLRYSDYFKDEESEEEPDDDGHYTKEFFTNKPIDCYSRLKLTQNDLENLLEYGKLEAERCEDSDKTQEKYSKFYDEFNNPYGLDIEYTGEEGDVEFLFYDYDYSYYLIYDENLWITWCTESDIWGSGEDVPTDTP